MIGIIGPMDEEVAELQGLMEQVKIEEFASMSFYQGKLCGKDVVLVRSGVGKTNATACAQILITKYNVEMLINTGIAGSLNPQIDIGDVVISKDAVHHDMDITALGLPVGQIYEMDTLFFEADKNLIEIAKKANEEANPDVKTFIGRVASGDQFVATDDIKQKIVDNFQADCVEMEGASIAHVAYLNNIPYVIIRAISDKADDGADVDYNTFIKLAIDHSVKLICNLLPRI